MTKALAVKYVNAPQGGREAVVTPTGIKLAKEMATEGHPLYGIAATLGLDPKTLRACRKRQSDLENALVAGHAALEGELVNILLESTSGCARSCFRRRISPARATRRRRRCKSIPPRGTPR